SPQETPAHSSAAAAAAGSRSALPFVGPSPAFSSRLPKAAQSPCRGDHTAEENIDAEESLSSLSPDDADLDRSAVSHAVNHGDHGVFGEVHGFDSLVRAINRLSSFQYHVLELGQQMLVFGREQRRKDAVAG